MTIPEQLLLAYEHENDLLYDALASALSTHTLEHFMRRENPCAECARLNRILDRGKYEWR